MAGKTAKGRKPAETGFFAAFDYTRDALTEIQRYFTADHKVIVPLTGREIVDEEIARKLA